MVVLVVDCDYGCFRLLCVCLFGYLGLLLWCLVVLSVLAIAVW